MNVQATDGKYADKVRVTWGATPGTGYYELYRALSLEGTKSKMADLSSPPYDDTSAAADTKHYYWVAACSSAGCSNLSESDSGYRSDLPIGMQVGASGRAVTHQWRRIDFATPFVGQPILVVQIVSEQGSDNAHVDLKGVSSAGFHVRVEEDLGKDGVHDKAEEVHWIAVPAGDYGVLQAGGTGEGVTHVWRRITFPTPFAEKPILVAQIVSENGSDNAHIDIKDVAVDGFSVRVEEDLRRDGKHVVEDIHWIAMVPGRHGRLLAGATGEQVTHLWYSASFSSGLESLGTPIFVGQLVSERGSDNSHLDLTLAQYGFKARVEEDTKADGRHVAEEIHYIAIEQ